MRYAYVAVVILVAVLYYREARDPGAPGNTSHVNAYMP